ncbi:pikachurin like protein [Danaus plexippus plexippus]|uniref:Pikachurin like protein n=1 Tax=Danaus plexippus plexippus TaxID=278856 RepID=A0A212FF34_DANPL|nr:pikachurin like protein [Danaus plexippus plexippus]
MQYNLKPPRSAHVPRFNGSSYLRLPGLGNTAQSWLDIRITVKPTSGDGLLLYDAEHPSGDGDFFSLHLRDFFVEFAFDLGSGIALVRSAYPLSPNKWHSISISRTGRHASIRVRSYDTSDVTDTTRSVTSRGAARRLTLTQPMLLGGAPYPLPQRLALKTSFSGCVGKSDSIFRVVRDCKETLYQTPEYPRELSAIHHSIVAKKGFKIKNHKTKTKKHHEKKKYPKKYVQNGVHMQNDIDKGVTEQPYDGRTYMQVKYLDSNEINWGDTNTYPSFTGTDSFIHIDDEETMKRLLSYTLDINIRFRSVSSNGLLVWSGRVTHTHTENNMNTNTHTSDFLSLAVENSVLVFRWSAVDRNERDGEIQERSHRMRVSDITKR